MAVAFAKATGARDLLHARADFGATDAGALVRVMSPNEFADQAAGNARALLAKAEADARGSGAAFESVAKTSDRPYEGIIDTARERGCDLVFMACHGRHGFKEVFLGSQTQKVLARTLSRLRWTDIRILPATSILIRSWKRQTAMPNSYGRT
jgi:nucleotide-binding universal stress UspA family protein